MKDNRENKQSQSLLFEKINNIDKPLAILINKVKKLR